jgi:hypothetical protein
VRPEYITMSRKPGLGSAWLKKHQVEVARHDSVIINGREVRPPAFYDRKLEEWDLQAAMKNKKKRREAQAANAENATYDRLAVKEEVAAARRSTLVRKV